MKKAIINILLIIFVGVLVFSGYRLYSIFSEYRKGREQYKKTAEQFMTEKEDELSAVLRSRRRWK